jgi:O-antigen ligase
MGLLQAVLVGLIALIIAPGQMFYFDVAPKVAVLLVGTAVLLIGSTRQRALPHPYTFWYWVAAGILSLAISTLLSTNHAISVFGSTWREYGTITQVTVLLFAALAAWNVAAKEANGRAILRAIAAAAALSGAYGVAQYCGRDPFQPSAPYHIGAGIWTIVRPPGTMGYASYLATWLLMAIFLCIGLARWESNVLWKRLALATAAIALIAMLLTGTRAAVLGLMVGGAVWAWWGGYRINRKVWIGAAVALLCGIALYLSPAGQQMRSRTRWFVEDPWGGARPLLWHDSLHMGFTHLAAGFGPEVFSANFPHYESKELAKAYPNYAHESPHNMFLDALLAQGIPGLAVLLGLCGAGFAAAWRLKRRNRPLAACLAAALAAGIVSQQFTAMTVPTAVLFFTVIALAAGLASSPPEPRTGIRPAIALWIAAAPLVALALAFVAFRLVSADVALQAARRSLEAGDLHAASEAYDQYRRSRLPGVSADLWYSRALMEVARKSTDMAVIERAYGQAEDAAERAILTAEEPFNAWYNAAQLLAMENNPGATERCLRAAIQAHPYWFKPHWTLAQLLALQSRPQEAGWEAEIAADLDNGKDPEVAETLRQIRGRAGSQVPGRPPNTRN